MIQVCLKAHRVIPRVISGMNRAVKAVAEAAGKLEPVVEGPAKNVYEALLSINAALSPLTIVNWAVVFVKTYLFLCWLPQKDVYDYLPRQIERWILMGPLSAVYRWHVDMSQPKTQRCWTQEVILSWSSGHGSRMAAASSRQWTRTKVGV